MAQVEWQPRSESHRAPNTLITLLLLEGERIDGAPVEGIPALKLVIEVVLDVEVLGEVPNQVRYEQVLVVDEALNVGLTEFAFDVVATSVVEAVVMLVLVFKDDAEVEVLLELVVGGSGCCKSRRRVFAMELGDKVHANVWGTLPYIMVQPRAKS